MDHPSPKNPQKEPNQPLSSAPERPRRKRTFPVHYRLLQDERGNILDQKMYYHHEWLELKAQEAATERAHKEADDAARAAREAELAASRPLNPIGSQDAPTIRPAAQLSDIFPTPEPDRVEYPVFARRTSAAPSSLVASTPTPHLLAHVPPDYDRHSRLCSICSHPDRDAIEGDFVRWRKPAEIIDDYNLSNRYALYRHAHACGLYQRRQVELARVLEKQLENADDCPLEQFDVITRAVRAHAHLNGHGRWFEPTRTHHVLTGSLPAESPTHSNSFPASEIPPDSAAPFDISVNLPNPG